MGALIPKRGADTPEANGQAAEDARHPCVRCPARVLLVEDHGPLARAVRQGLQEDGFLVDVVAHGEAAVRSQVSAYVAIILDLVRLREAGLALLRHWRREGDCPRVVVLTEPGRPTAEADDCLAVPFDFDELLTLLRTVRPPGGS